MKTSELKKKIRASALSEMPDVLSKIDLSSIDIVEPVETISKPSFSLRRILSYSFTLLFVGVVAAVGYLTLHDDTTYTPLTNATELIAFQAISSASLLEDIEAIPLSFDATALSDESSTLIQNELDTINQYLNMMEIVLGDTQSMMSVDVVSDNPDFEYEIIYRNVDLVGTLIEFRLYYNLFDTDGVYSLEGILTNDVETYIIEGVFADETLSSFISFRAALDEDHYVECIDLSTSDSQQFRYRIYAFNAIQNEGDVSLEKANDLLKASIHTSGVNSSFTLGVERINVQSQGRFRVMYMVTSGSYSGEGEFEVGVQYDEMTQGYHYNYIITSNGDVQEFTCGRGYKGNRGAKDDDFTTTSVNTTKHPGMGPKGQQWGNQSQQEETPNTAPDSITISIR